jgi:hypothetical protein
MTRPLRRAHRLIWMLLPGILLALLAWGVASRKQTTPINASLQWESAR